jgi:hypothetical protein
MAIHNEYTIIVIIIHNAAAYKVILPSAIHSSMSNITCLNQTDFLPENKCYMSFTKYIVEQRAPPRLKATYANGAYYKDTTSLVLPPGINFQFA